jgi:hypothetical protein
MNIREAFQQIAAALVCMLAFTTIIAQAASTKNSMKRRPKAGRLWT